jgi:hypothetical protein
MPRVTTKGKCVFCNKEFSKAGMTRHLETCVQREASAAAGAGSRQKLRKTRVFHLLVEGRYSPMYWMHLQVTTGTTLGQLDHFLRDIWLECCGHLSAFRIGGVSYASDAETIYGSPWDMGDESMRSRLDKVLTPGQSFTHEYDFGSTTELNLKVISEWEVETKGKAIQILARNDPPAIACDVCGKPATEICTECVYSGEGWLCDECAKDHECGEEMMLPVVNSPRVGVCGYTG